jgi:phosphoglycerate dehydrogenase-like enzyme
MRLIGAPQENHKSEPAFCPLFDLADYPLSHTRPSTPSPQSDVGLAGEESELDTSKVRHGGHRASFAADGPSARHPPEKRGAGTARKGREMRLVICPPKGEEWLAALQAEAPGIEIVEAEEARAADALRTADAFYGRIRPEWLAAAPRLRWIQSPVAGLEHSMFPELVASPVVLTNMRGIYSDHIADHAYALLLALARGLPQFMRRQARREWSSQGVRAVHLPDATLGILGLGGIGRELARRAKISGMTVLAVDARPGEPPPAVDALWPSDRLRELLEQSNFVAVCAPHTPETERLLDREKLAWMQTRAFLINVSRGVIVDLGALTAALQEGRLAGAALDVFETEPLPADHPLWEMENVLITPHAAWMGPDSEARRLEVLRENLRRFVAGEPLLNVVDKARWF